MIPIEETKLYKLAKDHVSVKVRLDESGLSDLRTDVQFRQQFSFLNDDLNDPNKMENHAKNLAEDMFYTILEQCGITRKDYQFLIFCKKFTRKDYYDYISASRGYRMGARDSRDEESSGVMEEE